MLSNLSYIYQQEPPPAKPTVIETTERLEIQAEITKRLRAGEIITAKDVQQYISKRFNKFLSRSTAQLEMERCGFGYDDSKTGFSPFYFLVTNFTQRARL
mgnify:FL=1